MSGGNNVIYLAERAKARNDLLKDLFREHGLALERFLRARLVSHAEREDILQDVFVRIARIENVVEKLADRSDTIRSYLFTIATNLIRDRARRAKVRERHDGGALEEDEAFSQDLSPEEALREKERVKILQGGLRKVKTRHRQAFLLSRFEGKSYREIADILDVAVSTVEKYISNVLFVLRRELYS